MGNLLHMANNELAKPLMATLSHGKSVTWQSWWERGTWYEATHQWQVLNT